MLNQARALAERLEKVDVSPKAALAVIVFVGLARDLIEDALNNFEFDAVLGFSPVQEFTVTVLDFVMFYLGIFLLLAAAQRLLLKRNYYAPLLLGIMLGLMPPVLDALFTGNTTYFYVEPHPLFLEPGISAGELAVVYGGILLFAFYIWARTGELIKGLAALFAAWATLQIMGSLLNYGSDVAAQMIVPDSDWMFGALFFVSRALLFLAPLAIIDSNFRKFLMYRASRIFLFMGLSAFSIALFETGPVEGTITFGAAFFAYLLLFMTNRDAKEDKENKRPEFRFEWITWAVVLAGLGNAMLLIALRESNALWIVAGLAGLALVYNRPLNLKRSFPGAYLVEGLAFTAIMASYGAWEGGFGGRVLVALGACFLTFAIGSAVKDYKDAEGDRKAGVRTAFTVLGKKGRETFWNVFRVVLIIGPLAFIAAAQMEISVAQAALWLVFALGSGYVLFFSNWKDKEKTVDAYIWLFSGLLFLSGLMLGALQ
ncbi:MAG: UbiA family prenyltransferase [Candidatus Micrarchaeia archaeon]